MTVEVLDGSNKLAKPDVYETSDIKQAAILRECGHKLVGIRDKQGGGNRKIFVFASSEVREDIQKILNDEISLPALRLLNRYEDLRTVMFNRKFK